METLEDIQTYIADIVMYCDVISNKESHTKSKIAFTHLMGNIAERIKVKCDKLEKELANAEQDKLQD